MAIGDIGAAIIDSQLIDGIGLSSCRPVEVATGIYAVAYTGGSNDGFIRTFPVDAAGDIGAVLSTREFDTTNGGTPKLHRIGSTNTYMVVYTGSGASGVSVKTVTITDAGVISAVIDTLVLEAASAYSRAPEILHVSGEVYAYAYQGPNVMRIKTWDCDDAGDLGAVISSRDYAITQNKAVEFKLIAGNVYFVACTQAVNNSTMRTFTINNDGTFGATIDSWDFDTASSAAAVRILKVGTGIYAIVWYSATGKGLGTFAMTDAGVITKSFIDTVSHGPNLYDIMKVDEGMVALAYQSTGTGIAQVQTWGISAAGVIDAAEHDHLDYLGTASSALNLFRRGGNIWGSSVTGPPSSDLWIKTFEIEMGPIDDRIYVFLGTKADPYQKELTDPDYPTVLAVRSELGRDSELAEATSGICELTLDNFNGDFSPENAAGEYFGLIDLGAIITFFEVYNGVRNNHFTGKIDKLTPKAEVTDPLAYILAVDGMDDLAGTKVKTVLRTDTDTGTLVGDVLDEADDPTASRDIDSGVDTLQIGWFHNTAGLANIRLLEKTEDGRFHIDAAGKRIFENRHHRITGDGLVSQHDFEDTAVELNYEYSKRLLYNEINVTGRRYYAGSVTLFSGYDMATLDDELAWSAHAGDVGAPYIPQNSTLTLWAEFGAPLASYTALVKGTHWNANTSADKTGTDVSDNITLTQTQYGQAVKLEFANGGGMGAYLVVPDTAPAGAPANRTCLVYGVLYGTEAMAITEADVTSQDVYGKRSLDIDTPFMSNPNDILAHAQYLRTKYHLPVPRAISIRHTARTGWPDDTLRVQCLTRKISDRITVKSTRLSVDRDFYINKVIQDYVLLEGGTLHETTWIIERALGNAEGLFWLLGVADFGELGITTTLTR